MIEKKEIIKIGKFQKTHALHGELNVIFDINAFTVSENTPIIVEMDGIYVPFYISSIRPKGTSSYLVKFNGIDSEEEAKKFVNKDFSLLKKDFSEIHISENEEIYNSNELIGFKIYESNEGLLVGEVIEFDTSTENYLFKVKNSEDEIIYIPAVEDFIQEIDDLQKVITMSLPEGLLDLNKKTIR